MAEQNKYKDFIEYLIRQTNANKIRWKYLEDNEDLATRMSWNSNNERGWEISENYFSDERSFFCEIDGMNIALITPKDGIGPSLYVIPYTFKNIVKLDFDNYGSLLTRLMNMVMARFPNADRFITDILQREAREAS